MNYLEKLLFYFSFSSLGILSFWPQLVTGFFFGLICAYIFLYAFGLSKDCEECGFFVACENCSKKLDKEDWKERIRKDKI